MEKNDSNSCPLGFSFEPEAVVLGGGDFPVHAVPLHFLHQTDFLVCCDGAANSCQLQHIQPWRIVGDGDSLSAETRQQFADRIRLNPDQETNDQTKAIRYLVAHGFRRIAVLGATGRREDHTLGNISLLLEYQREGLDVRIYTDYGVFIPCRDTSVFQCPIGTAVSVFSKGATGMSSEGLAYPLYDLTALWQGTLNHSLTEEFTLRAEGEYLVYLAYENKKERV